MYVIGARPSEAAWMGMYKKFVVNPYEEMRSKYPWVARMPKQETKTDHDYEWFIPAKHAWLADLMQKHAIVRGIDKKVQKKRLNTPHDSMLRKELGLPNRTTPGQVVVNFRSIRRHHANRWEAYYLQCKAYDIMPIPTPLQHTNESTAHKHYLDHVVNNILAQREAIRAEGKEPTKRLGLHLDDEYE